MPARRTRTTPVRRTDRVLEFMRLLWAIEHRLQSTSKHMGSRLGVTGPQRLVLKVIHRSPGLAAVDVAEIVQLHQSTLTGIIQRLIDKGLVVRARDPEDTRRMSLRALPAATRVLRRTQGTVESAVEAALEGLPRSSVRAARAVLQAVASALEQAGGVH